MTAARFSRSAYLCLATLAVGCGGGLESEEVVETPTDGEFVSSESALAAPTTALDFYMVSLKVTRQTTSSALTVNYTVGNNSLTRYYGSVGVKFYASTDATLGSDDLARLIGTGYSLPGQATYFNSTWPAGFTGTYVVYQIITTDGVTTNNKGYFRFLPDLGIVYDTTATTTATRSGMTVYVNYAVKNAGFAPAGASVTRFRLVGSTQSYLLSCSDSVPALAAQQRYPATGTRRVTCTIPTGSIGSAVIASADDTKLIAEANEVNDSPISAPIAILGPQLSIPTATVTYASSKITIRASVKNVGTQAAGASNVLLTIIGDGEFYRTEVCHYPVPAVAAGATVAVTFTCTVPSTSARGTKHVGLWTDSKNQVAEAKENKGYSFHKMYAFTY